MTDELRVPSDLRHGRDCPKVEHLGKGYLHEADYDGPYDVDGVAYCGRCHGWLGTDAASRLPKAEAVSEAKPCAYCGGHGQIQTGEYPDGEPISEPCEYCNATGIEPRVRRTAFCPKCRLNIHNETAGVWECPVCHGEVLAPLAEAAPQMERWGVHYDSMPHTCIDPEHCDCNCGGCVKARGFEVEVLNGRCVCGHVDCPHCSRRIAVRVMQKSPEPLVPQTFEEWWDEEIRLAQIHIGSGDYWVSKGIAEKGWNAAKDSSSAELSPAIRMQLWLTHGCGFTSLYGDDGEMQCNCIPFIDFKRDSEAAILEGIAKHNEQLRLAEASSPAVAGGESELANRIAADLFINGNQEKASRLVLELTDGSNGGGWCRQAVVNVIAKHLKIENLAHPLIKDVRGKG